MEPATNIGKFLAFIGSIMGAMGATYLLTRIFFKKFSKRYTYKDSSIRAFIGASAIILIISTTTKGLIYNSIYFGFIEGFFTYMPFLILWLVLGVRKARKIGKEVIIEKVDVETEKTPIELPQDKWKWTLKSREYGEDKGNDRKHE